MQQTCRRLEHQRRCAFLYTLTGVRIAEEVAGSLVGTSPLTLNVAQQLAAHYEATRAARVEQLVLSPRGLDFNSYYGRQASMNPRLAILLDQQISQFDLTVELLVAGVDATGAHIYTIRNPGRPAAVAARQVEAMRIELIIALGQPPSPEPEPAMLDLSPLGR